MPRNVLKLTLKGLLVKTRTDHPGKITWVSNKCERMQDWHRWLKTVLVNRVINTWHH